MYHAYILYIYCQVMFSDSRTFHDMVSCASNVVIHDYGIISSTYFQHEILEFRLTLFNCDMSIFDKMSKQSTKKKISSNYLYCNDIIDRCMKFQLNGTEYTILYDYYYISDDCKNVTFLVKTGIADFIKELHDATHFEKDDRCLFDFETSQGRYTVNVFADVYP